MLTGSDNDHEALSAIRHANMMLAKENFSWCHVLKRSRVAGQPVEQAADDRIRDMLDDCLEYVTGNGVDFIESLDSQYTARGWLSSKQIAALEKFFRNLKKYP